MADEVIGGVAVQITGDISQLNAALGSAVSIAGIAGGNVAGAFNTGAAGANEFTAATEAAAAAEGEFAGATEVANAALGHQVSQLQATSGAIRTALGEQSIRAAERFLTMIPGLGAALQVAFPVIGAVALFSAISRVVGKSEDLKAALKEQQSQAEATNRADEELARTLDRIGASGIGRQFGTAAQSAAEATALKLQANDIANQILDSESRIRGLRAQTTGKLIGGPSADVVNAQVATEEEKINQLLDKQQGLYAEAGQAAQESGQKRAQEAGALGAARVSAEEQTNAHLQALNKVYSDESIAQSHAAVQIQIAAMHDREAAAVATAAEELRVAQAKEAAITSALNSEVPKRIALIRAAGAAEAAGKSQPEQARIAVETGTKVGDYQAGADAKVLAAHEEATRAQTALDVAQGDHSRQIAEQLATAWERSYDAITKAAKETQDAIVKSTEAEATAQVRVMEIQDKAKGQLDETKIQGQKIALEGQYGSVAAHTLAQQIAYMQQIAALDHESREAKIAGLQAELQTAEALDSTLRDEIKIATLKGQIAQLSQQDANASQEAANAAASEARAKSAGGQVAASLNKAPGQLGNALAGGIVDGKNIGKDIRDSLKGIGKEMLGEVFSGLITATLGNTISTVANTVGGVANTAVTGSSTIATIGNTIATEWNTIWLAIKSVFGFAEGTDSAPGGMAWVGEKGKELVNLPRGAQVIPNHKIRAYADGTGGSTYQSTAFQTGTTNLHFHAHGMSNPDQFIEHVMRKLPETLKRRSPQFSPLSH